MKRPIVLCGLGRMGSRVLDTCGRPACPSSWWTTSAGPTTRACTAPAWFRRLPAARRAGGGRRRRLRRRPRPDQRRSCSTSPPRSRSGPSTPEVRVVVRMFNHNLLGRLGKRRPQRLRPQHVDFDRADRGPDRADRPGARRLPPRRPRRRPPAGRGADRPRRQRAARPAASPRPSPTATPWCWPTCRPRGRRVSCWKWTRKLRWRPATGWWCAASRGAVAALMAAAGEDEAPHLRWAGWLRRLGRMTWAPMRPDRPGRADLHAGPAAGAGRQHAAAALQRRRPAEHRRRPAADGRRHGHRRRSSTKTTSAIRNGCDSTSASCASPGRR